LTLSPTSGAVQVGLGGTLTAVLTPTITGTSYDSDWPSATIAGNPTGIGVAFTPVAWQSSPPHLPFTMTIVVSTTVPVGTYIIRVDVTILPSDQDCSGTCVQPIYTLEVAPPGTPDISVQQTLQDGVIVADAKGPSATAALSDTVKVADAYVAPAVAALSDVVGVVDKYVAPATAILSDGIHLVDTYLSPVTAKLSDAVSIVDQLAKVSTLQKAELATGISGAGTVSVSLAFWKKKSKKKR
jgi:hypothetical protein